MTPEPNPYAPPLSEVDPVPPASARTGNLFALSAGDATRFVFRHPLAFLLLSLGFSLPFDIVDTYVDVYTEQLDLGQRFTLLAIIAANVVATFSWAALTEMARQDATGERFNIATGILVAVSTVLTLVVCDVLIGMLIVAGMVFLLLPGLYLGMRFFFLFPIVVVERQSVWRSLQASWQFTASRQLVSLAFGAMFFVQLATVMGWALLLNGVVWELLPWENLPEEVVELSWLLHPAWRIPTTLLADWFTVMTFYGYWRLREQATGSSQAAAEIAYDQLL
jgi:hypothetical protein